MANGRDRKILRMFGILFGVLCLCLVFSLREARAAGKRLVKVAFFPMDGYHIMGPDGSYDGMDVAYLEAICGYTGWEVQYVECGSWEDALRLLSKRQVDLVGSAQYSAERALEYEYADLASGYTFGVIATNAGGTIAYEDFTAMRGITFGVVKDYVRKDEFLQYLADNGISRPKIREYESTAKLQQALDDGEIDALVHTFTELKEGQRLIGRFAPRPFYYISYKGNDDVMRGLNQAVADLKINRPELEAELMNEFYYSRFDKSALLTIEEKEYLAENKLLTVGYLDGHYPFSYEEGGEFKGLSREMLERSIIMVGQDLEYMALKDEQDAKTALKDGVIDILVYCTDTEEVLGEYRLAMIREYADIPLALVMDRGNNANEIRTLATVPYLLDRARAAFDPGKVTIKIYTTQQQCMDEVKNGKVDAVLCDGYLAEHLFRTDFQYERLRIKNIFSSLYPISVAVRKDDELLSGILAKTITTIDPKAINEYMLRENTYPLVNIRSFIQNHSVAIIALLFCIVVLVILVAGYIINDEKKIRKLMYKDAFMDIWNLNYLIYWGEHKLLESQKDNYAVVFLNLSQFRHYNIIYGWSAGERLLQSIAYVLKQEADQDTEICARSQGDCFAFLLRCTGPEELLGRLKLVKKRVEACIFEKTENRMSVRMGVCFVPRPKKDLRVALNYAAQAFDYTEDSEDHSIEIYNDKLEQMVKEQHEREQLLESVDVEKDFTVYYQPKVDIRDGVIVGSEALVRFLDPTEGGAVRPPGFFVPYYEQTGKILDIDFFVYEAVCRMLRRRLDAGKKVVPVSCNFSRMHFIKPGYAEDFEKILVKYQIPKELIEVEITETVVIEEIQQQSVKQTLDVLSKKGIRLSIDDFGAGYSSLGIFEQIPAAVVKLDRSFLLNQKDRGRQVVIMRGIVNLIKALDAQVVCEGVETDEDVQLMQEIGAYVAQGYYYFRPIPEDEFEKRLDGETQGRKRYSIGDKTENCGQLL